MPVYFIGSLEAGCFKIGFSGNPCDRLRQLQTASAHKLELMGTIDGSESVEREMHDLFAEYRMEGEWFCLTEHTKRLVDYVLRARGVKKVFPLTVMAYYVEAIDTANNRRVITSALVPLDGPDDIVMELHDVAYELKRRGLQCYRIEAIGEVELYSMFLWKVAGMSESEYFIDQDVTETPICMGGIEVGPKWAVGIVSLSVENLMLKREIVTLKHRIDTMVRRKQLRDSLPLPTTNGHSAS